MHFLNVNIDIFRRCDEIYVLDFHWGTKLDKNFNNSIFILFFLTLWQLNRPNSTSIGISDRICNKDFE